MAETQQSSYPEFPEKRDLLQPRMVVDVSNYPIPRNRNCPARTSLEMIGMAAPESSKNGMGKNGKSPYLTIYNRRVADDYVGR
ncbi:hypothetical protein T09_5588 [Trichinella sp. T9]|nr:hypothetical protein T09_5588 [Trichinella sp. T9]